MKRLALAPFAATCAMLVACGGSEPPPAAPSAPVATPAASATTTSAADAGAAPSPLATILTTDPAQLNAIATAAGSAPPPKTSPPGTAKDLEAGLAGVAAKAAPGMQPDGDVATGTLKEGEHLAWTVTMHPGKCYAIVGWSPTGEIVDLDLHLLAPPLYTMLSGEDTTDDNAPVVGRTPNAMCPVFEVGMPYKVDLTAQKGAGRVAAQLYSKAKP